MENLEKKYNVSRETIAQLKAYEASLIDWQQKFNLVSNSSLEDAWNRHFADSLQLLKLIPENAKLIYDFGSGAGFPGMVLAVVMSSKTPYLKFKLVESIGKKTLYLNFVAELCHLNNVEVINERIEKIKPEVADVITSRAMCSLAELFDYTCKFYGKNTKCIFPKGKKHLEEISEAQKNWNFTYQVINSETSDEGVILLITNLSRKRR